MSEKTREELEKNFYLKYSFILQAGYSFCSYLKSKKYRNIVIYGTDEVAVTVVNDISECLSANIIALVDHNKKLLSSYKSIQWRNMTDELVASTDLVIVTYLHTKTDLICSLKKRGYKNVIGADNIVDEIYRFARIYEPGLQAFRRVYKIAGGG